MSRKHSRDDSFERDDLFEDDQSSSSDDRSKDDCNCTSKYEDRDQGRGRRGGRSRQRDDANCDNVTGIKGKGYTFELSGGKVTNLMRIKKCVAKPERIDNNETWTFVDGNLIKSEIYSTGTEIKTYTNTNNGDIFTFASESFVPLTF
jgi:hypothetical protein